MKPPTGYFRRLYRDLKVYAFFWWGFNGMNFVYVPLYYISIGLNTAQIFFMAALTVLISLVVGNFWTKISDASGRKKPYIVTGNIIFAGANLFLLLVDNLFLVFLYSVITIARPPSDAYNNALVYQIAVKLREDSTGINNPGVSSVNANISTKIRSYTNYRKFGSIGWATALPFAGLLIIKFGFAVNFILCAIGFLAVSLFLAVRFDEKTFRAASSGTSTGGNTRVPEMADIGEGGVEEITPSPRDESLLAKIAALFKNVDYRALMILVFFASIASQLAYTNASVFVNIFARDNFILVGLYYSVGAYLEWPVMMLAARGVEDDEFGWRKVLVVGYLFNGAKVIVNPFFLLFDIPIGWLLMLSSLNGFAFGLRWPATTYGINDALEIHQQEEKSMGFSLNSTVELAGAFLGNLLGTVVMSFALDDAHGFIVVYTISALISIAAAFVFYWYIRRKMDKNKEMD